MLILVLNPHQWQGRVSLVMHCLCQCSQTLLGIQSVLWNTSLTYNGYANPYTDSRAPDIIVEAYAGAPNWSWA